VASPLRTTQKIAFLLTFAFGAILAAPFVVSAQAQNPTSTTFVSFDVPGAGTQSGQGTFPFTIANGGWVAGTFISQNNHSHGFLRAPNGSYKKVDPPNAVQTSASGVNVRGQVAGSFTDGSKVTHGFFRDNKGVFTQLDPTGATSTRTSGINGASRVIGVTTVSGVQHGFIWDPVNGFTLFDAPGASSGATFPVAINGSGEVTGVYLDSNNITHIFIRRLSGKITSLGANDPTPTSACAINANGQIAGTGVVEPGDAYGFLRNGDGTSSLWNGGSGIVCTGLNKSGVVVGYEFSDGGSNFSFQRDAVNNVTSIPVPFSNQGANAAAINDAGQIVGTYIDANGVTHGWLNWR
jgi:hypothetical protein